MKPTPKKESSPDFANPAIRQAYVQETHSSKELLQKELNVNQAEQLLLKQRIELMRSFINDLPSSDPQYSMLLIQVEMDQVEMNELKTRELLIIEKLSH